VEIVGSWSESSVEVARPIEEAFDCITDATNEPKWNGWGKWVKKVSDGPIGRGTTFHGDYQVSGEMDFDLRDYECPRKVTYHPHTKQMEASMTFSLEAIDGGTRVSVTHLVEPNGWMRRMAPLIPLMMNWHFRGMTRGIGRELGTIKSPDRLRLKVREALTKTAGAKRVAEAFAAAGGPRAAADAFEARLIESKPAAARQL
jgi:uncharacterized protein YndB with AHSA1/START domain